MTWNGQADYEQETAGGGGKFTPAPRGLYTIQVADLKQTTTATNRDMVKLECEIADDGPEFGKKVWDNIVHIPKGEKGHGIMLHKLHAFGIILDSDYNFDPLDLQGCRARVLLGVEPREKVGGDGKKYINQVNFIEEFYTENHPEPQDGKLPTARERKPVEQKRPLAAAASRSTAPAQADEEVPF